MKRNATFGLPAIMALIAAFAVFVSACYSEFPLSDVTRVDFYPAEVELVLGNYPPDRVLLTATLHPHIAREQVHRVDWSFGDENTDVASFYPEPDPYAEVVFDNDGAVTVTIVAGNEGEVSVTIEFTDVDNNPIASASLKVRVDYPILGTMCGCDSSDDDYCTECEGCTAGDCTECAMCNIAGCVNCNCADCEDSSCTEDNCTNCECPEQNL